jgi:hypothetical protein
MTTDGWIGDIPLDDVQRRLRELGHGIWDPVDSQVTGSICHYTSLAAFEGMLASGTFWLSDMTTLNDKSEFVYFNEILPSVILRKSIPSEVKDWFRPPHNIFGSFGATWFGYVMCFCRAANKLEQWDRYADGAKGVAISFDYGRMCDSVGPLNCGIVGVLYDQPTQVRQTERMIDGGIHLARELDIRTRDKPKYWFEVVMHLLQCSVRFKNPAFSGEEEVRILSIATDRRGAKTRTDNAGRVTQYVEVQIPFATLDGVMLGPRSTVSESQASSLLVQRKLNVPVSRSNIPLR